VSGHSWLGASSKHLLLVSLSSKKPSSKTGGSTRLSLTRPNFCLVLFLNSNRRGNKKKRQTKQLLDCSGYPKRKRNKNQQGSYRKTLVSLCDWKTLEICNPLNKIFRHSSPPAKKTTSKQAKKTQMWTNTNRSVFFLSPPFDDVISD
jgi:hypothetical protein